LHPGTRIVKQGQQQIIALAVGLRTINLGKKMFRFSFAQVAKNSPRGFFEGNSQNSLALRSKGRLTTQNVSKKRMDGRQTSVPRPNGISPDGFQMTQELQNDLSVEIFEAYTINRMVLQKGGETKKYF
jgi:hypothetical protein